MWMCMGSVCVERLGRGCREVDFFFQSHRPGVPFFFGTCLHKLQRSRHFEFTDRGNPQYLVLNLTETRKCVTDSEL